MDGSRLATCQLGLVGARPPGARPGYAPPDRAAPRSARVTGDEPDSRETA